MIIRFFWSFKYAIVKESNVYFSNWNWNGTLWKDTNTVWKFSEEFSQKWQAQWLKYRASVVCAVLYILCSSGVSSKATGEYELLYYIVNIKLYCYLECFLYYFKVQTLNPWDITVLLDYE